MPTLKYVGRPVDADFRVCWNGKTMTKKASGRSRPQKDKAKGSGRQRAKPRSAKREARPGGSVWRWVLLAAAVAVAFAGGYVTRMATVPIPDPVTIEVRVPVPVPTPVEVVAPQLPRVAADLVEDRLYEVEGVVDGDTFDLKGGLRVRLLGVNTPESGGAKGIQWYGVESKEYLRELINGRSVRLEPERGERFNGGMFGRVMAYAYAEDGLDLVAELVRLGYARSFRKYKCARREEFNALEAEAQSEGRGLWNDEARKAWEYTHIIPEIPLEDAAVLASKASKIVHLVDCSRAPAVARGIPFVDLDQAARFGYTNLHTCLTKRYPEVSLEEATLIASKGSKLLHAVGCSQAPTPATSALFRDLDQAREFGFKKLHTCLEEEKPEVSRAEATLIGTKSSKLLHRLDCRRSPSEASGVLFRSLEEAEERGFTKKHSCLK
ncbi:thermonuclease family protein [Planctomycetota bacterium]